MKTDDPLFAPVKGADHREICGVQIDMTRAGKGRVRRVIYPAGFRWSKDMKAAVGTDFCTHAHIGFIVRGDIEIQYADGCRVRFSAPQAVVIEPGHDGWVAGEGPAVLIEVDFESDTAPQFGLPAVHRH
ncbi:MAG TPA: hypothetical protein VJ813_15820 [Vicinamibacterales bacterium]|nr:hypothetical protein [Vicinamibacterales bacterium]